MGSVWAVLKDMQSRPISPPRKASNSSFESLKDYIINLLCIRLLARQVNCVSCPGGMFSRNISRDYVIFPGFQINVGVNRIPGHPSS